MTKSHIFGKKAESAVANLLQSEHFTILEQNYTKFFGEIDIIAKKDDVIVFVEVKARNNSQISMFELVTQSKQQKVIKTACAYISEKKLYKKTHRFDVALVEGDRDGNIKIRYIPNAFCQTSFL